MAEPSGHPSTISDDDLLAACKVSFTRRSGPGGQHRNKVETAVVIEHQPTGFTAEASEARSQAENRQIALMRLRLRLAVEVRTHQASTPGDLSQLQLVYPSSLWRSRLQHTRIRVATDHRDWPSLLAEVLDVLQGHDYELPATAQYLATSSSQLVNLLKRHPPAFALLNARRLAQGKLPLR